jgi:FkbH-like protein
MNLNVATQRAIDWNRGKFPLLDLGPESRRDIRVRLVRNWPCEPMVPRIVELGRLIGLELDLQLSPYFDSIDLELTQHHSSDLRVVWLDSDTLGWQAIDGLPGRLRELNAISSYPSLIVADNNTKKALDGFESDLLTGSSTRFVSLDESLYEAAHPQSMESEKYGHKFNAPRFRSFVSKLVMSEIATFFIEPIRVLFIDFDNTLYSGVLGEDTAEGLVFTPEHQTLWSTLRSLLANGVLLIGITKNDRKDVESLFRLRHDFGLTLDSFTEIYCGWDSKQIYLTGALKKINLAHSQSAFIDDNPSELFEMENSHPSVYSIDASDTAKLCQLLELGPRFPKSKDELSILRKEDLRLRNARLELIQTTPYSIHEALGSQVSATVALGAELARCQQLVEKTNQFNTSLKRSKLSKIVNEPEGIVVALSVSDKLGDSGIVATVAGFRSKEGALVIEEFCISCRVLGRNLEDILFAAAVDSILDAKCWPEDTDIRVRLEVGARNEPAVKWVNSFGVDLASKSKEGVVLDWKKIEAILESEEFKKVVLGQLGEASGT